MSKNAVNQEWKKYLSKAYIIVDSESKRPLLSDTIGFVTDELSAKKYCEAKNNATNSNRYSYTVVNHINIPQAIIQYKNRFYIDNLYFSITDNSNLIIDGKHLSVNREDVFEIGDVKILQESRIIKVNSIIYASDLNDAHDKVRDICRQIHTDFTTKKEYYGSLGINELHRIVYNNFREFLK